jgi:hypothetical protein
MHKPDRMLDDAREDLAQVILWVETVQLRRLGRRIDRGGALPADIGTGEQPIFTAQGDWAHRAFGGIVVQGDAAVAENQSQRVPARQGVTDRHCDIALARHPRQGGVPERVNDFDTPGLRI